MAGICTLSLIPGIGIKNGDYRTENLVPISSSLSLRVKSMNAIGYNGPLDKDLKSGVLEGQSALFMGYRF